MQKPAKKVKGAPEVGTALSTNRYEALSDSDADSYSLGAQELEQELKRVEKEYVIGSEDDPPTKRRPPPDPGSAESDMETGSQQSDSDSDL